MLDQDTKRQIDACRDVLVGKIPDPKSQVEQITIALIYKFMDDMDQQSIEMGGVATFFKDGYTQYSWSNMFSPTIGGHELVKLYGEAIEEMNQNPYIPQLFRDIFKNAYLPYRDPETLKLFLKEINGFSYSHSEKLGDAFEYLLSFMGTQGDAGQFRTPRHIIDFIAAVVNPQKHETILDPACGTAGFLISAYKHIMKSNDDGKQLTPADQKRLLRNFTGYDISPDMVRLSLVNLYLHGFQDPKIFEYDTLTSEDRWNDTVDVILANPPFMTPKGGIRPHKRFSVHANRSEVLFVDYIAEHLNPGGRAGVIVPEGIIFQSSNAYKNLRKMLIENYLWAVVSLPAGVFQPYSGVKTSILFLDKTKAKQNDSILFIKIENDGFGLGAQRRPIDKDDLPNALELLKTGDVDKSEIAHWVEKSKIAESGDWNLSGERYRDSHQISSKKFEMVELNDIIIIESGSRQKGGALLDGIPSIGGAEISKNGKIKTDKMKYISPEHYNGMKKGKLKTDDVLVVKDGATTGKTGYYVGSYEKAAVNEHVYIFRSKSKLKPIYLYNIVRGDVFQNNLNRYVKGIIGGISLEIKSIQIPLPPLSVQEEIVAEIDGYQKIIDGARMVVENYTPTIKIDPDWEMVKLGEVCEKIMDGTHFSPHNTENGEYKYITSKNVREFQIDLSNITYVTKDEHQKIYNRCSVKKNDILYIKDGVNTGMAALNTLDEEFSLLSSVAVMRTKSQKLNEKYLVIFLNSKQGRKIFLSKISGVAITRLTLTKLNKMEIPLPPISVQQEIVAQIEVEQEIVNANKKLIEIFQQKIKDKISEVWGE